MAGHLSRLLMRVTGCSQAESDRPNSIEGGLFYFRIWIRESSWVPHDSLVHNDQSIFDQGGAVLSSGVSGPFVARLVSPLVNEYSKCDPRTLTHIVIVLSVLLGAERAATAS